MAAFRKKSRRSHITVSVLSILTLFVICAMGRKIASQQHQWFIQDGQRQYEPMVEKIAQNKARLTDKMRHVDDLVDHQFIGRVDAATNKDGSLVVAFARKGVDARSGYLYYAGKDLVQKPDNTNLYYFPHNTDRTYWHLTSYWYEY
ncbi:MAG: hypothetical protein JWM68_3597 [Verrucomicrobiales bacterium]|nr:hypothetical protein [Verrucomicrobiales bacterium]